MVLTLALCIRSERLRTVSIAVDTKHFVAFPEMLTVLGYTELSALLNACSWRREMRHMEAIIVRVR